jgi:hypothetical protein
MADTELDRSRRRLVNLKQTLAYLRKTSVGPVLRVRVWLEARRLRKSEQQEKP